MEARFFQFGLGWWMDTRAAHGRSLLIAAAEKCVAYHLQNASDIMLTWKGAKEEKNQHPTAFRVPFECLRGNIGRSLVAADYPGHDVAWIPILQRVPGILRANRHKRFGGSLASSRSSRNYSIASGPGRWTKARLPAHQKRNRSCAGVDRDGVVGRWPRKNRK